MATEQYQGFTIESGEGHRPDVLNRWGVRWFSISDDAGELFTAVVDVSRRYGGAEGNLSQMAEEYGRSWIHGILNVGQYQRGQNYTRTLSTEWDPVFGEQAIDDETLRWEVLGAARSVTAAEDRSGAIHGLDVPGIALALGVRAGRVAAIVNELVREGLLAPYAESFGNTAQDGACQITAGGLRALRDRASQHKSQQGTGTRVEHSQIGVLNLGTIGQVSGASGAALHIINAVVADAGNPNTHVGMVIRITFVNVGQEPALNVRARFEHAWLEVQPATTVLRLVREYDQEPAIMLAGVAKLERAHPAGIPFPTEIRLVLQYRDPRGHEWESSTGARLVFAFEDERDGLQDTLELSDAWQVSARDQASDQAPSDVPAPGGPPGKGASSVATNRVSSEEAGRRRSSSVEIEVLPPTYGTPTLYLYADRVQLYVRINVQILNNVGDVFVRRGRVIWETVAPNGGPGRLLADVPLRSVDGAQTSELDVRINGPGQSQPIALHFETTVPHDAIDPLPASSRYVLHLDILGADDVEESIARFEVPTWPSSSGVMEVGPVWLVPPLPIDQAI